MQQAQYGRRWPAHIWFGIVVALLLCFATAIAYAELSKLYPGAGSSYFFAEQAFLSKTHAYRFARIAKYIVGWASHLYYWVYPGVMVGVTAILVGYLAGQLWPDTFNGTISSPTLMIGFCFVFSFGVASIAYRGVTGTTGVNVAVNVVQIAALLVFSVIAIGYRASHGEGKVGYTLDPDGRRSTSSWPPTRTASRSRPRSRHTTDYKIEQENGKDKPFKLEYAASGITQELVDKDKPNGDKQDTFQYHATAASVVKPHTFSFAIIQACIAILILVGFESVTSLGEEAKNAKRDIPRAVLLSLFIQGVVCYLIEYFAADYFHPGYQMAATPPVPRADRRHDGHHRDLAFRQPNRRLVVHVHRGDHCVPGPDRHNPVVHDHGRPGDLRHGPRRRGPLALRPPSRPQPDAAPGHLDPGRSSPP